MKELFSLMAAEHTPGPTPINFTEGISGLCLNGNKFNHQAYPPRQRMANNSQSPSKRSQPQPEGSPPAPDALLPPCQTPQRVKQSTAWPTRRERECVCV